MIKILFLILGLSITFPAQAQFATGYAPRYDYNYEEEADNSEQDEEETSSVFQFQSVQRKEVAPTQPPAPISIKKPTPYAGNLRILATVNGEIITTEDINNRVRAFCMTTGIPYNDQTKLLIINKVMQNTIDEKLKLQDAVKNKIDITDEDINNAIESYANSNKMSSVQLKQAFREFGVSESIFREQMKSDIAWVRLVRNKTSNDTITEIEIQDAIDATKKDMSKSKYMVSEIVIDSKNARNINSLSQMLRQDPRFEMYASQFSQSPSASSGGRLGWVNAGQLPETLDNALAKMSAGQISDPILYNGSYYIFRVEQTFNPTKDKMPEPDSASISEMLQGQKTERFAARHLQNLRQRAVIELKE